jgi:hypothetical protein
MTPSPDRYRRPGSALLVLGLALGVACATPGGPRGGGRPTDPDEEAVFGTLVAGRAARNLRPPTWVSTLEPLAHEGAEDLAGGAPGQVVGQKVVKKAVERFGHYISVWWAVVDDLHNVTWNPRLLSGRGLGVAVGVALMRTTAPGRYAVVIILPEPGAGASPQ